MTLIDLYSRKIIGYSAGASKDAKLMTTALLKCKYPLRDIRVFHSGRSNEYDNTLIDNILNTFEFEVERSPNNKGDPYDNAVIEATDKLVKTESIY